MRLQLALLLALLGGCATSRGGATLGIPLHISVADPSGRPIPTAVIRHPEEADRHPVNSVDGSWEESILYLPDGTELRFVVGLDLVLEVTAPGFQGRKIQYQMRKRKNELYIELAPIVFQDEALDDPVMSFGRDRPRDVGTGGQQ